MKKQFKKGDRVRTRKDGDGIVVSSEIRRTRPFSPTTFKPTGEWREEEAVMIKLDAPHPRTGRVRVITLSIPDHKLINLSNKK